MSKARIVLFAVLQAGVIGHAQTIDRSGQQPVRDTPSAGTAPQHEHAVPRNERERRQLILHLAFDHSLHEAAVASGGTFSFEHNLHRAYRGRARNLLELVRSSPVVIVGTPQAGIPQITRNGGMVETDYALMVTEVLKGAVPGSVVPMRVPGGRVVFPDGTAAEVATPGFQITAGNRYILFLRPVSTGPGTDPSDAARAVHILGAGPQGVMDVTTGRVISLALPEVPVRSLIAGADAATVMEEIRALVRAGDRQRP
jgi:hypothetical protein